MPRTLTEVQKDLDFWEVRLDTHLGHCSTCDEGRERYCPEGAEVSVMVTRLLMEKMRLQVKAPEAHDATPWTSGTKIKTNQVKQDEA